MKKTFFLAFLTGSLTASAQVSISVQPLDIELMKRIPAVGHPFRPLLGEAGGVSAAYATSVQVSKPLSRQWTVAAGLGYLWRYTSNGIDASLPVVRQAVGSAAAIPERGLLTGVTTRDHYLTLPATLSYSPRLSRRVQLLAGLQFLGDIRTVGRQTADFLPEPTASVPLDVPELKRDVEAFFARRATPVLLSVSPTLGFDVRLSPRLGLVLTGPALIALSNLAAEKFSLKEVALLSVVLTLDCWLVFIKGLGLTIPLWPAFLGS